MDSLDIILEKISSALYIEAENLISKENFSDVELIKILEMFLNCGETKRAELIYNKIINKDTNQCRLLKWELDDLVEQDLFNRSIYPSSFPIEKRWIFPIDFLPKSINQSEIKGWFPGRISVNNKQGVAITVAAQIEDYPDIRLIFSEFSHDIWNSLADFPAIEDEFVILFTMNDDKEFIVKIPNHVPPWYERYLKYLEERMKILKNWAD